MSEMIRRIFVEKKEGFNIEAQELLHNLRELLNLENIEEVRIVNRYDVSGLTDEDFIKSKHIIFSEPTVDVVYDEDITYKGGETAFAVQYLPGQYDQRADSAVQCIQLLSQDVNPTVLFARLIIIKGIISAEELKSIKNYCINPVDSREASLLKPIDLEFSAEIPSDIVTIENFISLSLQELKDLMNKLGLAMSLEDLKFCQSYFKNEEKRNPTLTEIKVIDTYWSDHCRHTTFQTVIQKVEIEEGNLSAPIKKAYEEYLASREYVYGEKEKDICLMDIAILAMKEIKKNGKLDDLDVSDEINACSIEIDADIDGKNEKWLVMFKNETHNHPTEIEPFGGAATCIGGCIRDPLSGRTYVYQAMRVTGSGDPRVKLEETLVGKLPQRKITIGAAHGYSSYGNQIGLATGQVSEIYDPGYVAKRMEVGAVIAAAPKENILREKPVEGDIIVLLGGRTGRDGCGGATGSSKEHDEESILTCGAEVQKGNAPTERKIQRLFRNKEASTLIKKCNDFGAGGVAVAIGELSDGLLINLDLVPKKYEGLDGTELSISESQERMAVVIQKENVEKFISLALEENLEAVAVATVKENRRLVMNWRGTSIVSLSRDFLDTNGVKQNTDVKVTLPVEGNNFFEVTRHSNWIDMLKELNICSQKGLGERFDGSIGAGSVLMPFGGKYQATPTEGMVAKLPLLKGETNTATIMTHGYNPQIAKWSPFHGAVYSVVEAITKVVACGGDYKDIRLTFQEFFEKPGKNPERWGKPFSALLGAFYAQKMLELPAIGGKDSMSGTFKDIDVPPTLVTFAVAVTKADTVISPEFKEVGNRVVLIKATRDENQVPNFDKLKKNFELVKKLVDLGVVYSAHTIKNGGIAEAVTKMSLGNRIGIKFTEIINNKTLFAADYGSLIIETSLEEEKIVNLLNGINYSIIGKTIETAEIDAIDYKIDIRTAQKAFEGSLEDIFPTKTQELKTEIIALTSNKPSSRSPLIKVPEPKVFIPVFPGTNCEYDSARAFEKAGAKADVMVFRNLNPQLIEDSIDSMVNMINNSQIIMLPGGFSAGDEPDGSGKFIAAIFKNPRVSEAVMNLLKQRDGIILGICNGFQALVKLGLVPFGEIRPMDEHCPTLTYNQIGRHVSCMVQTKIVSASPIWFNNVTVGDIHTIPVSHGEGRFVGEEHLIKKLFENGQVAAQYVDFKGNPTYDIQFNPNGSLHAIEGICSLDGRILGKMGHSERIGNNVCKNIVGNKDQKLFEAGVRYYK
ncbi:MAG: phosphoribosylformylglycinamidine synthase [Clostridiaceae bacterium]|nr:phosphoribosylformylglycinamidine synthase [Clostridiaceae bacterium]